MGKRGVGNEREAKREKGKRKEEEEVKRKGEKRLRERGRYYRGESEAEKGKC